MGVIYDFLLDPRLNFIRDTPEDEVKARASM
jgi:hypothetical protein